jgi:hypothetical protein
VRDTKYRTWHGMGSLRTWRIAQNCFHQCLGNHELPRDMWRCLGKYELPSEPWICPKIRMNPTTQEEPYHMIHQNVMKPSSSSESMKSNKCPKYPRLLVMKITRVLKKFIGIILVSKYGVTQPKRKFWTCHRIKTWKNEFARVLNMVSIS